MNMFCYQCQETGNRKGCTSEGVCGKSDETANLQDVLIYCLKGLACYMGSIREEAFRRQAGMLAAECLFATVTNTNFDPARIVQYIKRVLACRQQARELALRHHGYQEGQATEQALWDPETDGDIYKKSLNISVLDVADADERSLKETVVYGLKGMSAYTYHAGILGYYDDSVFGFLFEALYRTSVGTPMDDLMELVLQTGEFTFKAMALLDRANSETYGIPHPVTVDTGVGGRPGILVSGHELKDLEMLLDQSQGMGVDIYTNGEMILAQSLPFFRKYGHLKGNYGNAWWQQKEEFQSFNGPVLVTSNCIIPPGSGYVNRLFTSSVAGYPGVRHIDEVAGKKDFTAIIALAQQCDPPQDLKEPGFMTGFNHQYLASVSDAIVEAIRAGKIKKFVVMAGCDGRDQHRRYYTEKALALEEGSIILTAGCAKYRYIKQVRGEVAGIPKVLDAGQCSDSYSILAFAMHLMKVFGTDNINDLPVEIDMAWYDQKAIAIFLALLRLGVRKIKLGPTIPEYIHQYILGKLKGSHEISTVYGG